MAFCSNCGIEIGDASFCHNCGSRNLKVKEPSALIIKKEEPVKSLSFIFICALSVLGSIFLFLNGFFTYWFQNGYGGYYGPESTSAGSFFDLTDSAISGIFAVAMFVALIVFAVLEIKNIIKPLSWVSFGISCGGFMYVLVSSIIASNNYYYYNSHTIYGVTTTFRRDFESFGFFFYVVLVIFATIAVFSIFDALGKPLIKKKDKKVAE